MPGSMVRELVAARLTDPLFVRPLAPGAGKPAMGSPMTGAPVIGVGLRETLPVLLTLPTKSMPPADTTELPLALRAEAELESTYTRPLTSRRALPVSVKA